MCLLVAALTIATMRQGSSRSWEKWVKKNSRITSMNFWRADFGLFRDLLVEISWETGLKSKRALKSWLIFKDMVLKAQNGLCWHAESWSGEAEGQCRWTGSPLLSSNAGMKCKGGGSQDEPPGRTTETLLMCAGLEIRKQKLSRRWHSQEMWSNGFWKYIGKGKAKVERTDLIQF